MIFNGLLQCHVIIANYQDGFIFDSNHDSINAHRLLIMCLIPAIYLIP